MPSDCQSLQSPDVLLSKNTYPEFKDFTILVLFLSPVYKYGGCVLRTYACNFEQQNNYLIEDINCVHSIIFMGLLIIIYVLF